MFSPHHIPLTAEGLAGETRTNTRTYNICSVLFYHVLRCLLMKCVISVIRRNAVLIEGDAVLIEGDAVTVS